MSFSQLFLLQFAGNKGIQLPVFQCNKLGKRCKPHLFICHLYTHNENEGQKSQNMIIKSDSDYKILCCDVQS